MIRLQNQFLFIIEKDARADIYIMSAVVAAAAAAACQPFLQQEEVSIEVSRFSQTYAKR